MSSYRMQGCTKNINVGYTIADEMNKDTKYKMTNLKYVMANK